jgi:hypothetical protein
MMADDKPELIGVTMMADDKQELRPPTSPSVARYWAAFAFFFLVSYFVNHKVLVFWWEKLKIEIDARKINKQVWKPGPGNPNRQVLGVNGLRNSGLWSHLVDASAQELEQAGDFITDFCQQGFSLCLSMQGKRSFGRRELLTVYFPPLFNSSIIITHSGLSLDTLDLAKYTSTDRSV